MAGHMRGSDMLTISNVAHLLGVNADTVRRWNNSGILKAYRIGPRGDRRFRRTDIARFLTGRNTKVQTIQSHNCLFFYRHHTTTVITQLDGLLLWIKVSNYLIFCPVETLKLPGDCSKGTGGTTLPAPFLHLITQYQVLCEPTLGLRVQLNCGRSPIQNTQPVAEPNLHSSAIR